MECGCGWSLAQKELCRFLSMYSGVQRNFQMGRSKSEFVEERWKESEMVKGEEEWLQLMMNQVIIVLDGTWNETWTVYVWQWVVDVWRERLAARLCSLLEKGGNLV